ncbi:MAG: glycosyltransferase family 39 protein, partial [Actinomycetota bacterium]|nr:glycosyltransferase family 39 protein [Actinomycetota bacterium]
AETHPDDVFYANFFRHPPLYTGLGAVFALVSGASRFGISIFLEVLSILFSLALIFVIYQCGKEWFGWKAGLWAAFFFSVMPAARTFDSWAKQESCTLLFCLLFALFFFRKKHVLAGVCLGVSMLTKEIFVFLPAGLFIFLAICGTKEELKDFLKSVGIAILTSFWWYLFFSESTSEFANFFLGRSAESASWAAPWYAHITRLVTDLGWPIFIVFLASIILVFFRLRPSGLKRGTPREGEKMALFPLAWIFVAYFILSISVGKPPWMVYAALPAIALLCGWGFDSILAMATKARVQLAYAVAILICAFSLFVCARANFSSFLKKVDHTHSISLEYHKAAGYLNERITPDERVIMPLGNFNPVIAFYLKNYHPGSVILLPKKPCPLEKIETETKPTILLFEDVASPAEVAGHIELTKPEYLVMRAGGTIPKGFEKRARKIGSILVLDLRERA